MCVYIGSYFMSDDFFLYGIFFFFKFVRWKPNVNLNVSLVWCDLDLCVKIDFDLNSACVNQS